LEENQYDKYDEEDWDGNEYVDYGNWEHVKSEEVEEEEDSQKDKYIFIFRFFYIF
jgi:hypothetical protein